MDKLIVVKGKAGMGNRILSLLDAVLYAKITDRQIVVDWSDYTYSPDRSNVFSRFFSLNNALKIEDLEASLQSKSVFPVVWKGHLNKSVSQVIDENEAEGIRHRDISLAKYTIDINNTDYAEEVLIRWAFNGETYKLKKLIKNYIPALFTLSEEAILRQTFRQNLILNKTIQDRVDSFKENNFSTRPMIGVHIRYTDRKTSLEKYPKILKKLIKKYPKAKLFIATDNREVELDYRERYGHDNVLFTEKWYPENTQYLHQNPDCPDRVENGIEALLDMYLLAACDYLVCDRRSTFAVVAKLISNINNKQVIDVSKYSPKTLVKSWVKQVS